MTSKEKKNERKVDENAVKSKQLIHFSSILAKGDQIRIPFLLRLKLLEPELPQVFFMLSPLYCSFTMCPLSPLLFPFLVIRFLISLHFLLHLRGSECFC